jgi:hypothetical protein
MSKGWRGKTDLPHDLRLAERPRARKVTLEEAARRFGAVPPEVKTPGGFRPVAHYLVQNRHLTLQTVYSDGLSVLLVTMQRGVLPRPPKGSRLVQGSLGPLWGRRFGQSALVHWAYRGWVLTMVGDVSSESLVWAAERTGVAGTPRVYEHIGAWLQGLF